MNKKSKFLRTSTLYFDPKAYLKRIYQARDKIKNQLPKKFKPYVVLTLGSGGFGKITDIINPSILTISYSDIPGFASTTVEGHKGELVFGFIKNVPVIGFCGRIHFYELGDQPNKVIALKKITFPIYVARALEAKLYFATNAAGGLNPEFKPGELMIIESHIDIYFPNPLQGPQVNFMSPDRFQAQHNEYNINLRKLFRQAVNKVGLLDYIHEGVYCALPGPTYESRADSLALRKIGADAVGMSTVPEVIVATNIGMETFGLSLITNVIAEDGTNTTSHEEVMEALNNAETLERVKKVICEFFKLLKKEITDF